MKVRVNERGLRLGEHHHRAILSDKAVVEILADRELRGLSYGQLSKKHKVPKSTVAMICRGERRGEAGKVIDKPADVKRDRSAKVYARLSKAARVKAIRNGGSAWIESLIMSA